MEPLRHSQEPLRSENQLIVVVEFELNGRRLRGMDLRSDGNTLGGREHSKILEMGVDFTPRLHLIGVSDFLSDIYLLTENRCNQCNPLVMIVAGFWAAPCNGLSFRICRRTAFP
jgi:hypothetical protein